MGVGELPVEPGLADAGLADNRDDLAVPRLGSLEGLAELLQFAITADKAGEPTDGCGVQPGAHGPCADEFVDLDRLREALHCDRPSGGDLDVVLSEVQRRRGQQDRAGSS